MNSENEASKTNEFLRRRKLRLQQVREQSKDIAKKIRQRAKVEKLRAVVDLDAKKQKEYFDRQDKFVKQLEVLYSRGLDHVGASHQSASDLACQDEVAKVDLSKSRGKEAAAELRRKRQEKLDEQKKLLDRRLQAREAANELSRDKSSLLASKLITKSTSTKLSEELNQKTVEITEVTKCNSQDVEKSKDECEPVKTNDRATQWDIETAPNNWEPTVPALSLPNDDKSPKDIESSNLESRSDKVKRLDLFATSKEMPSSLQGKHTNVSTERGSVTLRPSLTLVSEYLQSRKLRLRETDLPTCSKKPTDDIHSLKQTIQRTRISKPDEVSGKSNSANEKASQETLNRKSSVTMYNHSTRNIQDLPCGDGNLVTRDMRSEEDAYSQAMRESSLEGRDEEHQKKIQDMRNKVAVTKQNVEKEYKDTINFLNSLPKNKGGKVIKRAFMDDRLQQMEKEQRQHKLQQEFRKIEKECKRHHTCLNKSQTKSKSPPKHTLDNDVDTRDFQYSWLPVPEGDGNLAIHTIPNNKEAKNNVKFSQVDSYHEYRSRHKHTPPTKDNANESHPSKKGKQTIFINKNTSESSDTEMSTVSESSSVENMMLDKQTKKNKRKQDDKNLSDSERIIIYKILDTKNDKKSKKQTKLLNDIAKSLSSIENIKKPRDDQGTKHYSRNITEPLNRNPEPTVSFEELNEGVYKVADGKGDNFNSVCFEDSQARGMEDYNEKHKDSCASYNINLDGKTVKNPLHWQCGKDFRRTNEACKCDLKKNLPLGKVSSTVTSTSSFKTATNDKPSNRQPDSGVIKFVDETGQEAGNFFIGASGFLNNNDYEVVIQLRKKDDVKGETELDIKETPQIKPMDNVAHKVTKNNLEPDTNIPLESTETNIPSAFDQREVLGARDGSETEARRIFPKRNSPRRSKQDTANINIDSKAKTPASSSKDQSEVMTELSDDNNIRLIKTTADIKMADKSVHTSFQIDEMPKLDTMSRPATTTYTQTSSPSHRPVFIHMSSSTSTAYMSPPDMILPHLLRQGYGTHDYCDGYSDCICKKCQRARFMLNKDQGSKDKYSQKHVWTPPNSANSCSKHRYETDYDVQYRKQCTARKSKCTCSRCESRDRYKERVKICKKSHKSTEEIVESNNLGRKLNTHCSANINTKNIYKTKKLEPCKSKLKPVVKNYVNKLLALNKEGLKAIEVANQDCSSVTTPGSSVINVAFNVDERKSSVMDKISLKQIKDALKQQIIMESLEKNYVSMKGPDSYASNKYNVKNVSSRTARKRPVHKVKSLNISKSLLKKHKPSEPKSKRLLSLTSTDDNAKPKSTVSRPTIPVRSKTRSKSSPRPVNTSEPSSRFNDSETSDKNSTKTEYSKASTRRKKTISQSDLPENRLSHQRRVITSPDSVMTGESQVYKERTDLIPTVTSTQTDTNTGEDMTFMRLAEDKLHNMEKIADLTEKCTKRLSNLAKVLDEVRKNKSLVYSQISTSDSTDSQSDRKSDKGPPSKAVESEPKAIDNSQILEIKSPEPFKDIEPKDNIRSEYVSFLADIPKPTSFSTSNVNPIPSPVTSGSDLTEHVNTISSTEYTKRPKPPISRMNWKHGHDIVPHELSTVIEVDSPMSVKHKNLTARNETKTDLNDTNRSSKDKEPLDNTIEKYEDLKVKDIEKYEDPKVKDTSVDPDLLQSNAQLIKPPYKLSTGESPDDSKFQMIDLKHFNEIMLEPFISIHEYARQYNIEAPDEGSNMEDIQRDDIINDDFSSLHSDGSLPDVIAELLKRNIIAEPFKFDTPSNVNSTTVSSESTLSMLALSKVRKEKKRTVLFHNKENIAETSDTLSISSNPDLENAFRKLGMGWASSTLKKTKERLALSSSSNTSSSSMSQFKIKSFNQDIPVIVTDTVSSVLNKSNKGYQSKNTSMNTSKHAEQQTSMVNSMTVKEFLTNELANKITFNNSRAMNETEEEFVSLFETKMPDEMKQASETNRDEASVDSMRNSANRARTSTPVQIYKSMTYHSSSSSNASNGLFSNADDLSSVKMTSNSNKNHSTSEKDDLTIPNFSLRMKKNSDCSKSDD